MFSDNEDQMVALLRQIANNTGDLDEIEGGDQSVTREVTIETQSLASRTGVFDPQDYIVRETDQLSHANADGTVTVQPGEEEIIAAWRPDFPFGVTAVGATDKADVEYVLVADNDRTIGGTLNSPLGTLNNPFSFVDKLGGAVSCENSVVWVARLDSGASASVDLAARIHAEVL